MNHKYGFHCNRTGDDVLDAIRRLKPRVIKFMDQNVDFTRRVRDILPDAFIIGRHYVPNDFQSQFVSDPKGKGRIFAERILNLEVTPIKHNGRLLFDAWESYNEVFPQSVGSDVKKKYDEFQVAFAERIRAAGLGIEPIAMNFATGNMLAEDFLNHFPGTLESYTYLGFHEYDWPQMWRLHWENIQEKDEGGMWLTLRYRRIMREVRRHYPNKHICIITECGMTQGVQGGHDVGPWHESHPVSEAQYWDSLMWYNKELMRDPYVMGACLFVVGAINPWGSFEHLGGVMNRLVTFSESSQPAFYPPGAPPAADADPTVGSAPVQPPVIPPVTPPQPIPVGNPAASSLNQVLKSTAAQRQVIQFNPGAALQKRIFADQLVPNSPEFEIDHQGVKYIGQRAEHLGSGEVRVYYVPVGDWGNVQFVIDTDAPHRGSRGLPPTRPQTPSQIV